MAQIMIDIFIYLFEMIISFSFISYNYERKRSLAKTIAAGCGIFLFGALVMIIVSSQIVNYEPINFASFFLINCIFFKLCFEINSISAIIYTIILEILMAITELIPVFLISYFGKFPTNAHKDNISLFIAFTVSAKILYFIAAQLFAFAIKKYKFKDSSSARYMPLFMFPLLSTVITAVFISLSFEFENANVYNLVFSIISVLMMISSVYIFIHYQTQMKKDEQLKELQAEKILNEMNDRYLSVIEHQNDEMHMMVHDVKNHFLTISNMKSTAEIDAYISEVMGNIKKYDIIQRTNNKMLDMLLSKYDVMCKNAEITLNIEAKTADLSYVNDADLSVLINNLMDNAFEAAKNSDERIIDFSLRRVNSFDILTVSNSCDSEPKHSGARLLTTKKSKDMHGLGTKIIKRYAAQNSAAFDWTYDQSSRKFSAVIMFNKQ